MTGRTTDDSRLAILLLDYEACREDERTSVLVQATMFTAAIALLGLVAAAVTQTCAFDPDRDRCTPVNHYLLASAPLLPYAVIVFVYSIGLMGNHRDPNRKHGASDGQYGFGAPHACGFGHRCSSSRGCTPAATGAAARLRRKRCKRVSS